MVFTSVDRVVRRNLLERQLPIHYYFEEMLHVTSCLRQLTCDTLLIVNQVQLTVDSYGAVDMPGDFKDDVGLFIPVGGSLMPISKREYLNSARTHNSTGSFVPHTNNFNTEGITVFGYNTNWMLFWNFNDYGEPTGRFFGAHGASKLNGYKVVKERRQIQLTPAFTSCNVVLIYISDGQSADNATQIEVDATDTLQAYTNWKSGPNALNENSPEARSFWNQRRLLRARLSDLSITDLRDVLLRSYTASIKN